MSPSASKAAIRAEASLLFAAFQAAGALPVEADLLLPAETLLDLYGEDIRARAYVTTDPLRGEMMLRPDFTVPVVQAHMADGADPARYCYMGEVFRKQEHLGNRASEYLQVGFEVLDRASPEAADAEVLPVEAQMTALAPASTALVMAIVIPRSLKDPVGFIPSYLTQTSAPVRADRAGAGMRGVPPSQRVMIGVVEVMSRRSAYSRSTPRHWRLIGALLWTT